MLCLGQGEALYGLNHEQPFLSEELIAIFRRKTAPAFGVSLLLGAIAAGCDEKLCDILSTFSESLGIAYQIRDDLEEYKSGEAIDLRASLLLALANEASGSAVPSEVTPHLRHLFDELMVVEKAQQLLEHYKNESIRALNPLQSAPLKSLLRRVASKMLGGV
ncbi:MAG: polyprenyl synthetase family protein [Kiritimatiellales bacterium]|nr:polyprenyl synthetase family protein [Kiritimatiellales bacterium]